MALGALYIWYLSLQDPPVETQVLAHPEGLGGEGHAGKLRGWDLTAEMAEFFAAARSELLGTYFLVLTQGDSTELQDELAEQDIRRQDFTILRATPEELSEFLAAADAALSPVCSTPSKVASSRTKIGEHLAARVPVVARADVGEVQGQRDGTGVVVVDLSDDPSRRAAGQQAGLMSDHGRRERRIAVARNQLSRTRVGIPAHCALYELVACPASRP